MTGYKEKFFLGNLELKNNLIMAPLAGCTDLPFRQMLSHYSVGLMYTEMAKMEALVRQESSTYRILEKDEGFHPIGAQICGSNLSLVSSSCRILEDLGFDTIDYNCGCPVDKVVKDGSGSAMLRNPLLIGDVIAEMVNSVDLPITVKVRIGWDDDNINILDIVEVAEKAGAVAITIHGRTRKQKYTGKSNWEWIKKSKEVAKTIQVIGNGDVFSPEIAKERFDTTYCDGLLIARGALGSPWLFDNIGAYCKGETAFFPTKWDKIEALIKHIYYVLQFQNEKKALLDIRRISCWYLKDFDNSKGIRKLLMRAKTPEEALQILGEELYARQEELSASSSL